MDVVISFDTTGSMFPCLHEVRRKVDEFIQTLFAAIPNLRIGIIAHGDYCDYPRHITTQQLTDDKNQLARFVKTVLPTNGGDLDECYEQVLIEVNSLQWRNDVDKHFILIGDANPHRVGYTYRGIKSFHVEKPWQDAAKALKNRGITLHAVKALNYTTNAFYTELAAIGGTQMITLESFDIIREGLTAILYAQQGTEQLQSYVDTLQTEGRFNRALRRLVAGLGVETADYKETTLDGTVGLVSVDPYRFQRLHVDSPYSIKEFVQYSGARFEIGKGYYQLTKPELVQEHKNVVLVDKDSRMYSGKAARAYIGLAEGERGLVRPPNDKTYEVYIQSTSVNRKLLPGTKFLYETTVLK